MLSANTNDTNLFDENLQKVLHKFVNFLFKGFWDFEAKDALDFIPVW